MDDDIAFNDWPNVDLHNNGTNSWFPAYGFHPPAGIIERDDFLGNPDADYFLNGTSTPCLYLETIHEETSDDLRSDSEISREDSPLGWLATDSETDSVICMDANNDETDCESDREIACPVKRRRQDNFLTLPSVDIEDYQSISRSSSLIQFETLEKQCQEISNSSPSIYSQFSYDSLEATRKIHQDNNNNNNNHNNSTNFDSVICDNETTLLSSNLKTWHSFDNLLPKRRDKFSAENLSEDSGYGEQMNAYSKFQLKPSPKQKANFSAYDCEIFQQQINGNFSASRQNLSVFNDDDDDEYVDDDHDDFLPSRLLTTNHHTTSSKQKLILERSSTECASKYTTTSSTSASVPDLSLNSNNDNNNIEKTSGICTVVVYSSVPKDLNLIGKPLSDDWGQVITTNTIEKRSIATTNCDLADFADDMANYKREGSYSEAMRNRVDLSDDEHSLCYNNNNNNSNKRKVSYKPKTTIEAFDRKILQVISESIHSMNSSQILDIPTANSGSMKIPLSTNRSTVSTPNLAAIKYHNNEQDDEIMDILMDEEHRRRSEHDIRRKSYSTNSGVSDFDDRSNTTKEVHFSPVVSEVNWKDDSTTTTAERESSYSMSSTPESELIENFTRALLEDNTSTATSQQESPPTPPPLSPLWQSKKNPKTELNPLSNTARFRSRSQPDMSNNNNKLNRRRLSMFLKKETDGTIVKAYIDCDGVQYKHTHLDEDIHGRLLGAASKYHSADLSPPSPPPAAAAAAASSSSPKLNSHVFSSTTTITSGNVGSSSTDRGRHGIITTTTTTKSQPVGVGMDADVVVNVKKNDDNERKKHSNNNNNKTAKFGGFFSRLASFRFTNKKGASDKKGKNKNLTDYKNPADALLPQQRIATKDDYIYIPLKGPSLPDSPDNQRPQLNNDQNGQIVQQQQQQNVAAARKPPLPRAPPRVVGASVKRNDSSGSNAHHRNSHHHHHHHHNHQNHPQSEKQHQQQQQLQQQQQNQHHHQQHRRRRTIDSGESCPRPMEPMGLIETDLDTEVTVITSGANVKTRSLMNLGAEPRLGLLDTTPCNRQRRLNTNDGDEDEENSSGTCQRTPGRPHKSMEFLLDKQNLKVAEPPENELQKGERVMSEHQLRVQRSLQKLNVPDWYKQSQIPREGFLLKKSNRETRWTGTGGGTGSKTTSLNSLGSNLQSPIISSPTNCNQTQPFIRWSTSKLNSTASSPCASIRSSFNARQPNGSISPSTSLSVRSSFSYRQPYLGWRSQERLTRPRTPAERLANSLLNQQQQQQKRQQQQQEQDSPEIQTSIKEVTSAIVHYVSGLKPPDSDDNRSESASPRGSQKLCWLESSFVGIRPLDSPETPVGLSENQTTTTQPQPPSSLRLDLQQTHNGESVHA